MKINISIDIDENELRILKDWDLDSTPATSAPTTPTVSHIAPPTTSAPTTPTVPKSITDFNKFKYEIERFIVKHGFEKGSMFYKLVPGDNVCVHLCISDRHISLYVYKYAKCEIYYNMSRDMTITRHNNSYVDNDVVRQIVGMFRRHSVHIIDEE